MTAKEKVLQYIEWADQEDSQLSTGQETANERQLPQILANLTIDNILGRRPQQDFPTRTAFVEQIIDQHLFEEVILW